MKTWFRCVTMVVGKNYWELVKLKTNEKITSIAKRVSTLKTSSYLDVKFQVFFGFFLFKLMSNNID